MMYPHSSKMHIFCSFISNFCCKANTLAYVDNYVENVDNFVIMVLKSY